MIAFAWPFAFAVYLQMYFLYAMWRPSLYLARLQSRVLLYCVWQAVVLTSHFVPAADAVLHVVLYTIRLGYYTAVALAGVLVSGLEL